MDGPPAAHPARADRHEGPDLPRERSQLLLRIPRGIDSVMHLPDLPFAVNQVRNSSCQFIRDRAAGAEGQSDGLIGVGDEWKSKALFFSKTPAVVPRIEAAADDLRVRFLVLLVKVPEPGTLFGSPGCIRLWEKPEDHVFSAKIDQPERAPEMIQRDEIRSRVSHAKSGQLSAHQDVESELQFSNEGHI